jgi:hypothetical protein
MPQTQSSLPPASAWEPGLRPESLHVLRRHSSEVSPFYVIGYDVYYVNYEIQVIHLVLQFRAPA